MKLSIALLSILVVAVLSDEAPSGNAPAPSEGPPAEPAATVVTTQINYDKIPIGSPVAWYPTILDVVIGYLTNWVQHHIGIYKVVKGRLLHHRQLLTQIPPFYDSINLYYDGDHLRSVLSRNAEYEPFGRNLNYTVPRPKVALEVIDTVKAIMDNLKYVKH